MQLFGRSPTTYRPGRSVTVMVPATESYVYVATGVTAPVAASMESRSSSDAAAPPRPLIVTPRVAEPSVILVPSAAIAATSMASEM